MLVGNDATLRTHLDTTEITNPLLIKLPVTLILWTLLDKGPVCYGRALSHPILALIQLVSLNTPT